MLSIQATTVFFASKPRMGKVLTLALVSSFMLFASLVAGAQPAHGLHHASGAVVFEYGWVPAARVAEHPPEHAETTMHGGARGQSGSHIVVALFDRASGTRIAGAKVEVSIAPLGGAAVNQVLQPMSIEGLPSYGGYVSVARPGLYRIRFAAQAPGIAGVASAEFEHRITHEGGAR